MFKIFRKNCCGLNVHKTWIYVCIGITDANGRTEYQKARFSSFSKGLKELSDLLAKYSCTDVCMNLQADTGFQYSTYLKSPVGSFLPSQVHKISERQQDRPQGCKVDLRPFHVRYD